LVCSVIVLGLGAAEPSWAGDIIVGTINLLDYQPGGDPTRAGMHVVAWQSVDLAKTCLAGATARWIQLATASMAMGPVLPPGFVGPAQPNLGMAGFPNERTFIDPIPKQPLGSGENSERGIDTPFYDVTANFRDGLRDPAQWKREGNGRFFGDDPNLMAKNPPRDGTFSLTFQTLLVATTAAQPHTLQVLGGFTWGFDLITNDGTLRPPAPYPATGLSWGQIDPKVWHTALDQYFGPPVGPPSYTLTRAKCKEGNLVVNIVNPEPSSIVLAGIAVVALGATRVLRRRASRRSSARSQKETAMFKSMRFLVIPAVVGLASSRAAQAQGLPNVPVGTVLTEAMMDVQGSEALLYGTMLGASSTSQNLSGTTSTDLSAGSFSFSLLPGSTYLG
jgi:hypothetical protein